MLTICDKNYEKLITRFHVAASCGGQALTSCAEVETFFFLFLFKAAAFHSWLHSHCESSLPALVLSIPIRRRLSLRMVSKLGHKVSRILLQWQQVVQSTPPPPPPLPPLHDMELFFAVVWCRAGEFYVKRCFDSSQQQAAVLTRKESNLAQCQKRPMVERPSHPDGRGTGCTQEIYK